MKNLVLYKKWFWVLFLTPWLCFAQEDELIKVEESAEFFLDEYSDQFQETFFEALKQKGIQNYDRAINLLLQCKQLKTDSSVDHELAKTYFLDHKYTLAEQYAIEAVMAEPYNYWYLSVLIDALEKQGKKVAAVKNSIPFNDTQLQQNLALVYFKKEAYGKAKQVLKALKTSSFKEELSSKIEYAESVLNKRKVANKPTRKQTVKTPSNLSENDPVLNYKKQIEVSISKSDFKDLEKNSKEAYEAYPLQPFFYYAYGLALNKNGKANKAVEVLESALDYIFDDADLIQKVYTELVSAYTAVGNSNKANEYQAKLKTGS